MVRAGPIKLKAGSKQQNLDLLVNRFERKKHEKRSKKILKIRTCDLSLSDNIDKPNKLLKILRL